ncbi:MAG TPA: hypothetical protein VFS44_03650 [Gemmatimonadaceae bacterium]|nr:hypothetical protein [Gemmatimonadaceae bacterium]
MELARDVLDKLLVDGEHRPLGRVDGLVLSWAADEPPRVIAIELGAATLAQRLPRWLGRMIDALARRFSPRHGEPYRLDWERVRRLGRREIEIDIDGPRSGALDTERWLRDHVIARIPGA